MNYGHAPFLYNWLPNYADPTSGVSLDRDTLVKGAVQKHALRYFQWVASQCHRNHIKDAFLHMLDMNPSCKFEDMGFDSKDNLLNVTLALALMEDIESLSPYLVDDRASLKTLKALISDYAPGCDVNLVRQVSRKGGLSWKSFCDLYSVDQVSLAIKVVVDDNLEAFQALIRENSSLAQQALARVAYDPLTNIRAYLSDGPTEISEQEYTARFNQQMTLLQSSGYRALINPNKPCSLSLEKSPQSSSFQYSTIECTDHQLRAFPSHIEMLRKGLKTYLKTFSSHNESLRGALSSAQFKLATQMIDDFQRAGVSRSDVLVMGILNYRGLSDYDLTTQDERAAQLPLRLLDAAADLADKPNTLMAITKLEQVHYLISQEPLHVIEGACTEPRHWQVLFRMTNDQKYLPMLKERVEQVFCEDLGL